MKTIDEIKEVLDNRNIGVYEYEENSKLCGYELNCYTNGGVNEIIFLDFRDENKDAKNPTDFIEEFKSYMNDYDMDDRIDINRQSEDYKKAFTLKESVKDFSKFKNQLLSVLNEIQK